MIEQNNILKSVRTGSQMDSSDFSMQCPLGDRLENLNFENNKDPSNLRKET